MIRPSVLFVCLGNICRSPLAAGAFRVAAHDAGFAVDIASAGTGRWHVGEAADPRARAVARRHGVSIDDHRVRQVTREDFLRHSHVIALDHANLADLSRLAPPGATAALSLLLDHVAGREGEAVDDPWYGDEAAFERAWRDVAQGAAGLLRALQCTG